MTRVNGENLSIYFALFLVCMEIYWNNVFLSHITSGSDRLINCRDIQYIFSCNHNSTTYYHFYPAKLVLNSKIESQYQVHQIIINFLNWDYYDFMWNNILQIWPYIKTEDVSPYVISRHLLGDNLNINISISYKIRGKVLLSLLSLYLSSVSYFFRKSPYTFNITYEL